MVKKGDSHIDDFLSKLSKPQFKAERQRAFLWTAIVHLSVLILFLLTRFGGDTRIKPEQIMLVDFETEEYKVEEKIEEEEIARLEMIRHLAAQELSKELRNIPVNVANKAKDEISTEKYLEELAQDYDFSERFQESVEALKAGDIAVEPEKKEKPSPQERKEYGGPTTITYVLENRHDRHLHVPVYLCERSGGVTIDIVVDRNGQVLSATLNMQETQVQDPCLHEAALAAARRSRFNIDLSAPNRQSGKISYLFMPQ